MRPSSQTSSLPHVVVLLLTGLAAWPSPSICTILVVWVHVPWGGVYPTAMAKVGDISVRFRFPALVLSVSPLAPSKVSASLTITLSVDPAVGMSVGSALGLAVLNGALIDDWVFAVWGMWVPFLHVGCPLVEGGFPLSVGAVPGDRLAVWSVMFGPLSCPWGNA